MSQVTFSTRIDEFASRPNLVPSFQGVVSRIERGQQLHVDPPRRNDRMRQTYGSGVPTASCSTCDKFGFAASSANAYEIASTLEGPVKLPKENVNYLYLPRTSDLDHVALYPDTRLQPTPNRYNR